jgi:endoglucanase
MMEKPIRVAKETGLPLYCGEYGVFSEAPRPDMLRWYRDMLEIFEENGISSANWNYKSNGFGFVGNEDQVFEDLTQVLTGD